jgi:hypothetical protein
MAAEQRKITGLFWESSETISVGKNGVNSIVAIDEENGDVWFFVKHDNGECYRYNSRFVDSVEYEIS